MSGGTDDVSFGSAPESRAAEVSEWVQRFDITFQCEGVGDEGGDDPGERAESLRQAISEFAGVTFVDLSGSVEPAE